MNNIELSADIFTWTDNVGSIGLKDLYEASRQMEEVVIWPYAITIIGTQNKLRFDRLNFEKSSNDLIVAVSYKSECGNFKILINFSEVAAK